MAKHKLAVPDEPEENDQCHIKAHKRKVTKKVVTKVKAHKRKKSKK